LIGQATAAAQSAADTWPFTPFGIPLWLTLMLLVAICGGIIIGDKALEQAANRHREQLLFKLYPYQSAQIARADELLAMEAPEGYDNRGQRERILRIRDQLAQEIRRQADPKVANNDLRIKLYEQDLLRGIDELESNIQIDKTVAKELNPDNGNYLS
jgi:hypothetical protein